MLPTIELLELAKQKVKLLEEGQQIRLTAEKESWYLFRLQGRCYIGCMESEKIGKFFKNRPQYAMINKGGVTVATLQPL